MPELAKWPLRKAWKGAWEGMPVGEKDRGGSGKGELLRLLMMEATLATSGEVEVRMARTLEAAEMEPARLSPNLDCLMRELLICCASLLKKLSRAKGLPGS
jgi:hypothetical protein